MVSQPGLGERQGQAQGGNLAGAAVAWAGNHGPPRHSRRDDFSLRCFCSGESLKRAVDFLVFPFCSPNPVFPHTQGSWTPAASPLTPGLPPWPEGWR